MNLRQTIDGNQVKRMAVNKVRDSYLNLAEDYNKVINAELLLCPKCGKFLPKRAFIKDDRFVTGVFPICKSDLSLIGQGQEKDSDPINCTPKTLQNVLRMIDKPYLKKLQDMCEEKLNDPNGVYSYKSVYSPYMTQICSLPQYSGKTQNDSSLDEDEIDDDSPVYSQRIINSGRKHFGKGWSEEDLGYLETQYQDWVTRYECDSKSQEILFQRICCKQLEIHNAQIKGKDTSKLDKDLMAIMGSLSVKPNQNASNGLANVMTFGQLIEKWEEGKPIPEPEEEFRDVDKIGLYIDVFFRGHLSKMMDLKSSMSALYDRFISKFTVNRPQYENDIDNENIFNKIFGSQIDKEDEENNGKE